MIKKIPLLVLPLLSLSLLLVFVIPVYAQESDDLIPVWVKGVFGFWIDDKINDAEVIEAIQFLIDSGIIKIDTNNEIINSVPFDCAKQWDTFQANYNRITEITIVSSEQMQRVTEKLEGSMLKLFKNECASTVNEWAYRTYDEGSVWMMGNQWELWAFLEEKMKEENLTFFEAGQKYLYNMGSVSKNVVSKLEETHSICGPGAVFDIEANSCVLR